MYRLIDFCCICFYNTEHLKPLSDFNSENVTYLIKLTSCVPEMCFNEMNEQWLVCIKCCETMDATYKFRQKCLRSKTTLTDYISKLHQVSNISGTTNVYLADINKFEDTKKIYDKKNNIEKNDMSIKINEENNVEINPRTVKRENNFSSKLIDTEHIPFENVVIEIKQDHFFKENVDESSDNSLVNQNNKIDFNQSDILTVSAIKIEIEKQDFEEPLHERFVILKTCDSANDDMEIKIQENYDYSLYSEKCTDDPLTNLNEIKIDIVDNDIESVNTKRNIQDGNESIEKFSTKDDDIPLKNQDEDETYKGPNFLHKSLERKQKETSLSKTSKHKKNSSVINQKAKIVKNHLCTICKKNFITPSLLTAHMRIHSAEKQYYCNVCEKKFNQSCNLRNHMKIHTGIKSHVCEICQKKFNQSSKLTRHMIVHSGEKPHTCKVCKKKFNQSSNLRKHMQTHNGDNPFRCDVCQKKFTHLSTLKEHSKTHNEEKAYGCSVCSKKFNLSCNLKEHMKIHSGDKSHECSICQKKFIQSSKLRRHMVIHTGEKPYRCDVCKKKFNQTSNLKEHLKIHI